MNSITEIKVKILNQGKNTDNLICLRAFAFFQNESHGHGRGLMKASLVLLIVKKLKDLKQLQTNQKLQGYMRINFP